MYTPTSRGLRVERRTRAQIRAFAEQARATLGVLTGPPDMAWILEHALPRFGIDYFYEPEYVMGAAEALVLPEDDAIVLREDIYKGLLRGEPHTRFTLAHEIGHLWLHERPGPSAALFHAEPSRAHGPLEDAECQADCFAAEFLMPVSELIRLRPLTAAGLALRYGVSFQAALLRVRELKMEGLIPR
jgi:hypothetical protein